MTTRELRVNNAKRNWFVLSSLVSRDFKLKYRRSFLGVVWSFLNPLFMMIIVSIVFSRVFKFEIPNFTLYLILGQTLFSLMSDSTGASTTAILDAAPLLKKIRVEKMLFPLQKMLFCLINYAISLVAVILVMFYCQMFPTWNIVFLPLLLLYVMIFCCGLGLLLSALTVFFRDIIHLWTVVIIAWTYATPIFYPVTALPEWVQTAMQFNPMYQFITYMRSIMMWGTRVSSDPEILTLYGTPTLEMNLICLGMSVLTLAIGILVFRKTERKFVLHI
jgi:ABC-2 type transport system permease protein